MSNFDSWPEFDDYRQLARQEQDGGTERGYVLLVASMLDDLTRRLLETQLEPEMGAHLLNEMSGALGAFSGRVKLARGLGLINKPTYECLNIVGHIRNKFAHKIKANFADDPEVVKLNTKLWGAWPPAKLMKKTDGPERFAIIGTALGYALAAAIEEAVKRGGRQPAP